MAASACEGCFYRTAEISACIGQCDRDGLFRISRPMDPRIKDISEMRLFLVFRTDPSDRRKGIKGSIQCKTDELAVVDMPVGVEVFPPDLDGGRILDRTLGRKRKLS